MQFNLLPDTEPDLPPDVADADDYQASRLRLALAAQHLVAANILGRGWNCSMAAEGLRYDLIADIAGLRRVQVKMTMKPRTDGGIGHARHGLSYIFGNSGNGDIQGYVGEIDLFAFVAMDVRRILYVFPHQTIRSRIIIPDFSQERTELSWHEVIRAWGAE